MLFIFQQQFYWLLSQTYQVAEQKRMNQQIKSSENHFDYIISALHNKKKKSEQIQEEVSLRKLYETMNSMVSGLDQSINSCKKYNEAKIHRKYEIMLSDQQKRIRFLEEKVKEEHRARSPSKKYIEELLDKLINYKFENEVLAKQNSDLSLQNAELRKKLQIYEDHVPHTNQKQDEKEKKKEVTENGLIKEISGMSIQNQISSYLKIKTELRKHENIKKTKFQRFLKKIKQRAGSWSMRQFLQSIDKWVGDLVPEFDKNTSPEETFSSKVNATTYNNIGNRINNKAQIRSRKTFSFRNFGNNSQYEGVLR